MKSAIFYDETGPLIRYENGIIQVTTLNPEQEIIFRLSRREAVRVALRLFLRAVWP